jgi:riboflavin kinase/FMN adenylyltransferase
MREPTRRAFAVGLFDGVHRGHTAVLGAAVEAARENDFEPAAATFYGTTMTAKNIKHRLILMQNERERRISKAGIEYIKDFHFDEVRDLSPAEFIKLLRDEYNAGAIIVGEDFRFGKNKSGDTETLKTICNDLDLKLTVTPELYESENKNAKISSAHIRDLLESGETEKANTLLGYNFYYYKTIIKGRQLGRTMGFPTINQLIPPSQVKVKYGVYSSEVTIKGVKHRGLTNVGMKPTVDYNGSPLLETYINDFSGDLYGKRLRVHLLKYIRPEEHFDSLEALKKQMEADKLLLKVKSGNQAF